MNGAGRMPSQLRAATGAVLVAGGVTATTAAALFVGARATPVVVGHLVAAAGFFIALAVKLALLGARARPGRARRLWRLLVAQLGGALAGYTLLTGILLLLDPAWSDQHLAASFWLGVVVVVHTRHYAGRLRGARPAGAPPAELGAALRRLDAPAIAVLDLSVRKGICASGLAETLGLDADMVSDRRREALERLGGAADLERRLRGLPDSAWLLPPGSRRGRRLVIVGGGMAGQAVAEQMAARGGWQITLLAEEDVRPYNRIALSDRVRDEASAERLAARPAAWYSEAGVTLCVGAAATSVDTVGRTVTDRSGVERRYDALVLATGSRAFVPPIPGAEREHVVAYRTLRDAARMSAAARRGGAAVVIGGGLLGLEAAAALSARGLAVTVIEAADRLMPQQLDDGASALLRRALSRLGVETVLATSVHEITATRVRLGDQSSISAELVVVAAGIRAETALARAAGLDVGRGITVDDELRTSDARIWAVGECAQHRGVVHGLWAPIFEQVRAMTASLDGEPSPFVPSPPHATLKVAGLELVSLGRTLAGSGEDEVIRSDGRRGSYTKLVVDADRLVGAILLGDTSQADRLRALMASGERLPADVLEVAGPTREVEHASRGGWAQQDTVCACMAVSRQRVETAIDTDGLRTVEDVAAATSATTGCGGCAATVAGLIDRHQRIRRRPAGRDEHERVSA